MNMTHIHYRPYESGDDRSIVDLWNAVLTKDPITSKRFRNLVLLDANFDPAGMRLAFDGDALVGCVYAVLRLLPMHGTELEPDNGWIPFFFVADTHRKVGIGRQLMREAVSFLREKGRKFVFFSSYAPNYILPGLDRTAYPDAGVFLERLGFNRLYTAVAMDYSLVGFEIPEDVRALKRQRIQEGYTFSQACDGDLHELIQLATNAFNPDWGRAIREGVLQGLSMEQIYVVKDHGKLVGFCLHGGYERVRERFGPFGVDPSQQGKGLGKILFYDCMQGMHALGLHGAWFLWTGEKTSAGQLYKRVGYQITRRFDIMRLELQD